MEKHNTHNLITKKHEGKWVALSENQDKILGYSSSLIELQNKIGNKAIYTKPLRSGMVSALYSKAIS